MFYINLSISIYIISSERNVKVAMKKRLLAIRGLKEDVGTQSSSPIPPPHLSQEVRMSLRHFLISGSRAPNTSSTKVAPNRARSITLIPGTLRCLSFPCSHVSQQGSSILVPPPLVHELRFPLHDNEMPVRSVSGLRDMITPDRKGLEVVSETRPPSLFASTMMP